MIIARLLTHKFLSKMKSFSNKNRTSQNSPSSESITLPDINHCMVSTIEIEFCPILSFKKNIFLSKRHLDSDVIEKFHSGDRERALEDGDDRVDGALDGVERADGGHDGLRLGVKLDGGLSDDAKSTF